MHNEWVGAAAAAAGGQQQPESPRRRKKKVTKEDFRVSLYRFFHAGVSLMFQGKKEGHR